MRIVYFLPDVDAGAARIVKTLLKYKPQNNDQYAVVLFSQKEEISNHPVADFEGPDEIIRFSYSSRENVYAVYRRLAKKILVSEQDIIVSNDGWEIRMAVTLKLRNPIVYIVHGDFKYYYRICNLNQDIIDAFIAYSTKIFEELMGTGEKVATENHHKVHKIYYPSSGLVNHATTPRRDTSDLKILFAGTLDTRKGAHLLKEIYDSLNRQQEKFELCIIGDGPLRSELTQQFAACSNVTMEGWKSNEYVIQRMRLSDIFLFPSFSEGLPNVLIEALCSGAVPVASKLESGVMDIINDGVNGCLVREGDVEGYANAIVYLNRNRDSLNKLKDNRMDGLAEKFEPYRQAALYDGAIKQTAFQLTNKVYPKYAMGRWLNQPWIPNVVVKTLRGVIHHPKL